MKQQLDQSQPVHLSPFRSQVLLTTLLTFFLLPAQVIHAADSAPTFSNEVVRILQQRPLD